LFASLAWTASPVSSFRASAAIHLALRESIRWISSAVSMALLFNGRSRFPICRSAQLTAFLTKFRSSVAARTITGRNFSISASVAFLSVQAMRAIRAKAARLTNSSSRSLHSKHLSYAYGVSQYRFMQTWSHRSQESKSEVHSSICRSLTRAGSSTIPARMRASWTPDAQSSSASAWSPRSSPASFRSFGMDMPRARSGFMP